MIRKITLAAGLVLLLSSFNITSLKGVWEYCGGLSNGKRTMKPTAYTLQRHYDKDGYEAFVIEDREEPFKYEAGNYRLSADTCFETQTYSRQPSAVIGTTIPYTFTVRNDTLILKGVLPNGTSVEDYWKKVK